MLTAVSTGQIVMGSLGWAQCYWCWRWKYDMYIVDELGEALCGDCIDLYILAKKPPWQPDARARLSNIIQIGFVFPANAAEMVAQFTHEWWEA